jgi:hypothetical protein
MRGTWGYSRLVIDSALGLLGLIVFVVAVISLAAGVTWLVVKIFPSSAQKKARTQES